MKHDEDCWVPAKSCTPQSYNLVFKDATESCQSLWNEST